MNTSSNAPKRVQMDAAVAGPLFMLAAALLFTLLNLQVKLLGPTFSAWDIGFYRFAGGIVVIVAVFGRRRNPFRGRNTRLLVIRGCTGSVAFICMVTAIIRLPVSTALVIFYAFPAFSAVFSYFIYGERVGRGEIACIVGVMAGVGVLFDFQPGGDLAGQAMALLGGAFAALDAHGGGPDPGGHLQRPDGAAPHEPGVFLLPGMGGRRLHVQRSRLHRRHGHCLPG
jgi:drug/metabolite transporter (DMT)-like permease